MFGSNTAISIPKLHSFVRTHGSKSQTAHDPNTRIGMVALALQHVASALDRQRVLATTQREQAETVDGLLNQESFRLVEI